MKTPTPSKSALTCHEEVYQWHTTLRDQLPVLTRSQAWGLALWVWATVLCQSCSLSAVSLFYAMAFEEPQNTARQRLREWFCEAPRKSGTSRREVPVQACFAPLLRWVLQGWSGSQLMLAMDATSLGERFVVLCVSVLYRGTALPVAWCVLPGNTPGAWRFHLARLLRLLREAVPDSVEVLVLADRGLWSPFLFRRLVRLGFHPFLRIQQRATFRREGQSRSQPLQVLAQELRGLGSVAGTAFQGKKALSCTLSLYWHKGCAEPWLILSDLPPEECQACWYGARAWIEHGFKLTKSEGFDWQRTRMTHCERVSRMWLVIAVANLWLVKQGSQHEDQLSDDERRASAQNSTNCAPPSREVSLFRRGWIRQIVALWKGEILSWSHPLQPHPLPQPQLERLFFDSA